MYSSSPVCRRFQLLVLSKRVRALVHSKPQLGFVSYTDISSQQQQPAIVRFFSTCSLEEKQSFTVSYLVNSCGLSLETATSISNKLHFKNPQKPDSVLMLLRNYGFTHNHITKLLRKRPFMLVMDPEKTLLPKFEFLNSIGIKGNDLVKFVCFNPSLLARSLENRIIPLYNFLKHLVCDDEKVAKAFTKLPWTAGNDVQKTLAPNVAALRQLGVPESSIVSTLNYQVNVVFQDRDKFDRIAKEVISMGYDLKKTEFIQAMQVFSSYNKSSRERKMEIYKSWGWSENDFGVALKKFPNFLALSEKNIGKKMDFLVNKMGYQPECIARNPLVICYNLEKRIIPRCLVFKVLLLKGLLKKEIMLGTLLNYTENQFLERFVTGYQEDVPQLLSIYQGKTSLLELGFSAKEVCGLKKM